MIREATIQDLETIEWIDQCAFPLDSWTKHHYSQEMTNNPFSHLLVIEESDVVGFVDYWITFELGDITRIAVHPDFQGNGFGELLLKEALSQMKELLCERCQLEVRSSNKKAISLYEKMGFQTIGIRKQYYENTEDALVMMRVV